MRPSPDEMLTRSFVRANAVIVGERSQSSWLDETQRLHPDARFVTVDREDLPRISAILERHRIRHAQLLRVPSGAIHDVISGAERHLRHSRIDSLVFDDVDGFDAMKAIRQAVAPFGYESFAWSESGMLPSAAWESAPATRMIVAVHHRLLPLLLGLPKRMLDIGALCERFGIVPRGAVHVGAHEGAEWSAYRKMGISDAIFVEANPVVFERLKRNVGGEPGVALVNCAVSDRTGTVALHVTSQDQSSSILPLGRHVDLYPEIEVSRTIDVPARTLDDLMRDVEQPERFNFLNIDVQGAELMVLRGGTETLRRIEAINVEVNFEELYTGCAQIEDMDEFLASEGYRRVATTCPYHPSWGDALYVRPAAQSRPAAHNQRLPTLEDAAHLLRSGRFPEAETIVRQFITADPAQPLARLLAGEVAFASGNKTEAADHFRTLALDHATPADIQHRASVFLLRLGDGAGSLTGLKHAARANTFPVLLDLGWAAESLGQIDEALAAYAAASRINPGDARPFTRETVLKLRRAFGAPLPSPPEKRQDVSAAPSISMTSLGHNGRFGNQLLQYAFARCYGRVHRLRVEVPEWIGRWLFDLDDPPPSRKLPEVREDGDRLVNSLSRLSPEVFADHDLWGYFCGHTKHFRPHRDFIRTLFTPGQHIRAPLDAALAEVRRRGRTLVAVHLRRGDFGTGRFWIAPERWYLDWLHVLWPSLDEPVLYVATDDADVIRQFAAFAPLSIRDVATSVPGAEFLTDFHVLSQADHMAISNSTFSFVAAMLNAGARMRVRPDPEQERLIPFDPWDSEVLLTARTGA